MRNSNVRTEPIRTRANNLSAKASNFKYDIITLFILENSHQTRSRTQVIKCRCEEGSKQKMKRRLQDISNQKEVHEDEPEEKISAADIRRRRVAMEKRRRDRINEYLNELSELVPEAAEKVGSTKLEKAEVLEMTVDYVKQLVKERKDFTQPPTCDPETERQRGFMTCMIHIKKYLEDSGLFKNTELDRLGQGLPYNHVSMKKPSNIINSAAGQPKLPNSKDIPQTSTASINVSNSNKICMDLVKNIPPVVTHSNIEQPVKFTQHPLWYPYVDSNGNASYSLNGGTYVNEINLPYGSYLSSFNEGY